MLDPVTEETLSQLDTSFTSMDVGADADSMESDSSYVPSSQTPSSESLDESEMPKEDEEGAEWVPKRRWIVDEDKLMELFQFCPHCGNLITKKEPHLMGGSRLVVKWECAGGCRSSWQNSPQMTHRAADNNILISASIFFTGATYTDIAEWADLIDLQIPRQTQFYSIQKNYLIPVIQAAYEKQNKEVIERLKQKNSQGHRTELCGDGRSDSPGEIFE